MKLVSLRRLPILASSLLLSSFAVATQAQSVQGLPQSSPRAATEQTLGVTEVRVDYHRPAVRGRTLWGGIVPYDQVWRAGANDNTTISFSTPVSIEGRLLPAGTYGLHMIPTQSAWTIAFSNNSTSWGSFSYQQDEDALRVRVTPIDAPHTEQLTYRFDAVSNDEATLSLDWGELRVPIRIAVDTLELTLEEIRNQLRHLPRFSWQGWASAAAYCQQNDFNHEEAMTWIDRSIQMDENFVNLSTKAFLQLQTGDSEADATLARALTLGNENQINNAGYQLLFSGQTEQALRLFRANLESHPESWNAHDSLAEGLARAGQTEEARAHYGHARAMAPETQYQRIDQAIAHLEEAD